MIISSYKLGSIIHFKLQFGEYFELTDLDELRYMLGILVEYNHTNHLIYISQKSYLKQFFKHFDISNLHSVSTPLAISNTLSLSQSSQSEENISKYKEFANSIHYLFLIGSLLYATQTCPNIQYTIGQIAQFSRNSGVLYLQTAKHILQYLRETVGLKLVLERCRESAFDLVRWTDSNWAQDLDN